MIRTILVDDEQANSEILHEILRLYCPSIEVIGSAENVMEALKLVNQSAPRLIFLDIQMPGGSGFDLLELIGRKPIGIVFVTAYDQFILQALRNNALDYLLKPLDIKEVITAVNRVEKKINGLPDFSRLDALLDTIQDSGQILKITVPTPQGYTFIPVNDITRLEAKGAYTEIFTMNERPYLVSKSIKEYEALLPKDKFFRVHNSHIVNLDFIKHYHKGRGGYIEMRNGITIGVAVRKKYDFLSRFR